VRRLTTAIRVVSRVLPVAGVYVIAHVLRDRLNRAKD